MEIFEKKFAVLLAGLGKEKIIDLEDTKMVDTLRQCLINAEFDQYVTKKKKLNGYNLYMKDRMTVLKETVIDSNARMSQISTEWNALSDEEKEQWKTKAKIQQTLPEKIKLRPKTTPRETKWSGYQVFVSEKMSTVKDKKPKERMTEIGRLWRALSDDEHTVYKEKAMAKNAPGK